MKAPHGSGRKTAEGTENPGRRQQTSGQTGAGMRTPQGGLKPRLGGIGKIRRKQGEEEGMKKSRILAYLLTACMTVSMPIQAFAFEGQPLTTGVEAVYGDTGETAAMETGSALAEEPGTGSFAGGQEAEALSATGDSQGAAVGTASDDAGVVSAELQDSGDPEITDGFEATVDSETVIAAGTAGDQEAASDSEAAGPQGSGDDIDADREGPVILPDEEAALEPVEASPATLSGNVYRASVSDDGTVEKQKVPEGADTLIIPKTAKRVADQAFKNQDIENVIFEEPSSVTAIGSQAFYNNVYLEGITIPSTTKYIGKEAFRNNKFLNTVSVNSARLALDKAAVNIFADCRIKTVVWKDGIDTVPDYLFCGAKFVDGYVVSFRDYDDIENIGNHAYYNSNVSLVDLEGIVEIDPFAFGKEENNEFESIKTLTLPKSLMYLGEGAFEWNSDLTTINIESTKIQANADGGAFYQCRINTINWPLGIKTIPGGLFMNAHFDRDEDINGRPTSYVTIRIPSTVTEIGPDAFSMYKSSTYDFRQVIFEKDPDLKISLLHTIGDYAFCGRSYTTSVNFEDAPAIKRIGIKAFYDVPLKGVLELDGIVSIGDYAFFKNGETFTSVEMGPYLKTLGKQIFGEDTKKIENVRIYSKLLTANYSSFSESFKGHSASKPVFYMNSGNSLYKTWKADSEKEGEDKGIASKIKMKSGADTIEHKIKYNLAGGKWGVETGIDKYYEGFIYTFEEPVLTGSKFTGWKLETVVGDYTETVIKNFTVIVARTEYNWFKDIELTAQYDRTTPYYVDEIVLKGTANPVLYPETHGNSIILSNTLVKGAKEADRIVKMVAFPYDIFGDLMNKKQLTLTWKSTDEGVVKLKKDNKDFTANFLLTGETGSAEIYVSAKGEGVDVIYSNSVKITVRSMVPTLSYTNIEVNKYELGVFLPLVENTSEVVKEDRNGNFTEVVNVKKDSKGNYDITSNTNFYLEKRDNGNWYLVLTSSYKEKLDKEITVKDLWLSVVTRYGTTYMDPVLVGPFNLKITVTQPSITLSQTPIWKGNPFYADKEKAKIVYGVTGSCIIKEVLACYAPDNAKYPCPWEAEVDPTGTTLTLKPYLITNYAGWHDKDSWNVFMNYMKQKVVLLIIGSNTDGGEFIYEKTITPTVPNPVKPKYTLDEITVFDYKDPINWLALYPMTVRDEYGNEIEDPDLRFEYPIAPATTTSNGIRVTRDGFLDLSGTPKNYKSGSVKVRVTSTKWTQPLDATQKISTSVVPEPDSLLLSVNSMKLSYDTMNKMDHFTVGVRYKGSKAIPDNIVYVTSDKGTPDDKAVEECVFHDDKGNLIFDCKGLVDIIDENPKWKGAHTFKFKFKVFGFKKVTTFTLAVSKSTVVSMGVQGNINILNREASYALLTPKLSGTRSDIYVTGVDQPDPPFKVDKYGIREYKEDVDSSQDCFMAVYRESDHKILILYDEAADLKPGAKKMSIRMDLSDGTEVYANFTVKLVQSQSGVKYEKEFRLSKDTAGYAETAFIIAEKKGTVFTRTYEIDRDLDDGLGGVEVLSFAKNANSRFGYADYIVYDVRNNKFILKDAPIDMPLGVYKLKLAIHYKGEYLNPKNMKPLTTITINVTVRDSGT